MRMGRYFWILFFSLISFYVSAQDYAWQYPTVGSFPAGTKSTPADACTTYLANYTATYPGGQPWAYGYVSVRTSSYDCYGHQNAGTNSLRYTGSRVGESCPAGTTYNATTGACVNPCSAKAGISERLSRTGTLGDGVYNVITASNGKKYSARGANFATGCMGGCMADTSAFKCTYNISHNIYACRGSAIYSGQTCASQGAIDPTATTLPDPEPQNLKDQQPCIYATDGSGKKTCTSKNISETEGQQCGTFNGQEICPPKLPNKNGVTIATEVTETSNADGTSTQTKKDTATTISCDGYESCVTKTTTITTTTTKDANGNSTGATSSCTGAYCANSNTSPDANGDGLGDCVDGSCSDGSGGDGTADGRGGPKTPELEDVPGFADTTTGFVNRLLGSPIASTAMALRAPSGACYKPSVDLSAIHLGTLTFSGHCDVLEQNRSLISLLAKTLWALAAFWILIG